jgi:hypothetical protein
LCKYVSWAASLWELRENKHILFLGADALPYILQIKEVLCPLNIKLGHHNDDFTINKNFIVKLMNGILLNSLLRRHRLKQVKL